MLKLAIAATVLLALTSGTGAANPQVSKPVANNGTATAKTVRTVTGDNLRGRVVDIQQTLDRILADTTPAPVGTSGAKQARSTDAPAAGASAVTVDRARLLQLRRQLDALLATLNNTR
jgi:hypothetical protein